MSDSFVRRPRMRLVIDGKPVGGCRSSEVTTLGSNQASSFRVVLAANEAARVLGAAWLDRDKIDVAVDYGMLPDFSGEGDLDWVRMITGTLDRASLDPVSGLVILDGRDHAARLIELSLQDGYLNKTSSEIVEILAGQCGLVADVDPTPNLIGQYYQIEHSKTSLGQSSRHANAWDLLSELADIEAFELWVDGTTLHFRAPQLGAFGVFDLTYVSPQASQNDFSRLTISDLVLERAYGFAGPLQVEVTSWNSRQRRQIKAQYPVSVDGTARSYRVVKPNLLPDEAEMLARTLFGRLSAHERVIAGTMPGELNLTPRHQLRLSGTSTLWDQTYSIERIDREMSTDHGFVQHVTARTPAGGVQR